MEGREDYGLIFWIHLVLVLIAYTSPLFFSWHIILVGAILLQIVQFIMGGCYLTIKELGPEDDKTTCIGYYLEKWHIIGKNTRLTRIFIRYVSKALVFLVAIFIQEILNYQPFIF